jgi:ABC-type multidrug transport system fused ATPase/permease subunit
VQHALDQLMRGRTSLIIAHRMKTVRNADRIVVLQHGRISEAGSHVELMQRSGIYERYVRHQAGAR